MKNTQQIEIVNIGDFKIFPIKAERQEFKPINKDGEELKSKRIGEPSHLFYVDKTGKEYTKDEVFYAIGNKKVQKISRTEKVNSFKIVEKLEVYDFLAESYSVLDYSDTTLKNFERDVGDKAVKFILKKSTTGFKFDVGYILKWNKKLIMISGFGTISEGIKEFTLMKNSEKKSKTIKETIEIKADELNKEIESFITI